jgi:hypothetical protein
MNTRFRSWVRSDRDGQTLAIVAVSMVALLAMMALAIDLGMLYTARSEAQSSADAIALAGASAFISTSPGQYVSLAKDRAWEYAERNVIRAVPINTTILADYPLRRDGEEVTVQIDLTRMRVTAWVRRDGLSLWFARFLGRQVGSVSAMATAEAAEAGGASCMVPFAIPEPTNPTVGQSITLSSSGESITPGVDPFYAPFDMPADPSVAPGCPRARGDAEGPWGTSNVCTADGCTHPTGRVAGTSQGGWFHVTEVNAWMNWEEGQPAGNNWYPSDFAGNVCGDNCAPMEEGMQETILTGQMDGPIAWGVNARIARDPDVYWNENEQKLMRNGAAVDDFEKSPRVLKVPTFDHGEMTHPSDRNFTINGFAYFFLEAGPHNGYYNPDERLNITGRFLYFAPGEGAGGSSTFSRILRLVQ